MCIMLFQKGEYSILKSKSFKFIDIKVPRFFKKNVINIFNTY